MTVLTQTDLISVTTEELISTHWWSDNPIIAELAKRLAEAEDRAAMADYTNLEADTAYFRYYTQQEQPMTIEDLLKQIADNTAELNAKFDALIAQDTPTATKKEEVNQPDNAQPSAQADKQEVTLEDARNALMQLTNVLNDRNVASRGILAHFGASRMSQLDPKDYAKVKQMAEERAEVAA